MENINHIMSFFDTKGTIGEINPFGNGHINDTYKVINNNSAFPSYLLQRINHSIFKDVQGLMDNIDNVSKYAKTKFTERRFVDVDKRILTLVNTKNQKNFLTIDGNHWRVFEFLELKAYDVAENTNQVYEGAKAFGTFLSILNDYPAQKLNSVIPDFHNMILRLSQFEQALNHTEINTANIRKDINLVLSHGKSMCLIENQKQKQLIPLRVVHHDTKFNNVLFNNDGEGMCVIDLDTVMPGIMHSDFGDGIRTGASTVGEEETDLTKIHLDIEKFSAFTAGYLEATDDILTRIEKKYLIESVLLFPFMQGVRFLTDYLNRNIYYKTTYEEQNLFRAQNQFQLFNDINKRKKELELIIKKHTSNTYSS